MLVRSELDNGEKQGENGTDGYSLATVGKDLLSVIVLLLEPRDAVSFVCSFRAAWDLTRNDKLWKKMAACSEFVASVGSWSDFVTVTKRGVVCGSCFAVFSVAQADDMCTYHKAETIFVNSPPTFSPPFEWDCCGNPANSWLVGGCVTKNAHNWKLAACQHPTLAANEFCTSYGILGEEWCFDCERQPCQCKKRDEEEVNGGNAPAWDVDVAAW